MIKSFFSNMQKKHDDKVKFAAVMQRYVLLKEALKNNVIYPVDKKYWEELIEVYEYQLALNNKNTDKLSLMMMKEEYQVYLIKLEEKLKEKS